MPPYQGGPGPNASQQSRVQPGPNASQSFRAVPGPNASQSFKSPNASQVVKAPTPGTTGTTYNGPAKTGSRGPVSTANHWKLVGGVVAGLVVVVVAAMLFQHRTPQSPDDPATSSKPG